jgi:hypothetical protein
LLLHLFYLDTQTGESILKEENQEQEATKLLTKLLQDKEIVALLQKKMAEVTT